MIGRAGKNAGRVSHAASTAAGLKTPSVTHEKLRVTVGGAVRDLALIATVMTQAEMRNRVEFLPL